MSTQDVLFDAPGPRARRRHAIAAVVGSAIALGLLGWAVWKLGDKGNLTSAKWSPFSEGVVWSQYLVPGIVGTLKAAAISVVLAMVLGLLLGLGRLSELAPVRWLCTVIIEFFRSVPVLLVMIFAFSLYAYNQVFASDLNPLAAVVTGLTLYNGAVVAELIRSGVGSLPAGQREAGLSIGLTASQTLRSIQLPQALTAMLPAIVSQLVVVLKDSALGSIITYPELLNAAGQIGASYANIVPAFITAAVIFILINYLLTILAGRVEQRMRRRGHTTGTTPTAPGQAPVLDPAGSGPTGPSA